jgi:hypothetical protein
MLVYGLDYVASMVFFFGLDYVVPYGWDHVSAQHCNFNDTMSHLV